jgi:hypothetical protein
LEATIGVADCTDQEVGELHLLDFMRTDSLHSLDDAPLEVISVVAKNVM